MSESPQRDEHSRRNPAGELHAQMRATRADIERQLEAKRVQFEELEERIQEKTGRNLIGAIVVGVFLGGLVLVSLLLIKELFMVFAAIMLGISAFELATAMLHMGRRIPRTPTVITSLVAVPVAYYFGIVPVFGVVVVGIALTAFWRYYEVRTGHRPTDNSGLKGDIAGAALVQTYVTLLGSFAVALVAKPDGQWWTLAFLITVVSVDTGAYISGLNFGKHLMAPKISPKKTWEGFAGAGLFAMVAGILLSIFMLGQPWWFGVIFGVLILISATLGDLGESQLKRRIGVKDMSSWLAGHGGFLDRLDSILPSAVVTFLLYSLVMG